MSKKKLDASHIVGTRLNPREDAPSIMDSFHQRMDTPLERKIKGGSLKEQKEKPERTTICVYPSLYKRFKVYAAQQGTTVTALFNSFMDDVLSKEDPDGQQ